MPIIFGTTILSVTYTPPLTLTITGQAFAENYYAGVSLVEWSYSGLGVWTAVAAYPTWSDTLIVATLAAPLASGVFDVRVTSSDGEQATLSNAIVRPASALTSRLRIAIAMGM